MHTATPDRVAATGTKTLWILAGSVCLAFVGLFIAITIVLALIPIYLPKKDLTPSSTTATADDAFYIQYSADTDIDGSAVGKVENLDAVRAALGLDATTPITAGDVQPTFERRKRSLVNRREKRTLKLRFRFKCVVIPNSWCLSTSCRNAAILKIQLKIKQLGNLASFAYQIRSGGVLKTLTFRLIFVEIVKIAPIGFGEVTSLTFVAISSGAFNDPLIWSNGIVPYGSCYVVIPVGIAVTLARLSLEIRMKKCDVYGSLVLGSGSPSFTFNYPPNIIIHSGGVLQDSTSTKRIYIPYSSLITLYPGGTVSTVGTILQTFSSIPAASNAGSSDTLPSSGPYTCGILPDGTLRRFNKVTFITTISGAFTSGSTYLGGFAPTADICALVNGCGVDVPSGFTLSTADLDGVLNIKIDTITILLGGILQLGTPGSTKGFKFTSSIQLFIWGQLSYVCSGGGIRVPPGSAFNFYSGGKFISIVSTFIQVFDAITGSDIGTQFILGILINGPYFITISLTGDFSISIIGPGGSDVTTQATITQAVG